MTRIISFFLVFIFNISASSGFGDIANHFTGYATFFGNVFLLLCFVVGLILAGTGLVQIRMHRQNPKFLPLINPIGPIFLGGLLILASLTGKYFTSETIGLHYRYDDQKIRPDQPRYDIDEPITVIEPDL